MNRRLAVALMVAGSLLSVEVLLPTATAGAVARPSATFAATPRPFNPLTDRLASDSTAHLNVAGQPGVVLPNLCEQRATSGIGGQPWTASCIPSSPLPSATHIPVPLSTPKPEPLALPTLPPVTGSIFDSLRGTAAEGAGPDHAQVPAPLFTKTGGPYISSEVAITRARSLAAGPIDREESRLLPYSSVVEWTGARTSTIALDREFYLVVLSAQYQPQHGLKRVSPCQSFAVLVDATYSAVFGIICQAGTWPMVLPKEFSRP